MARRTLIKFLIVLAAAAVLVCIADRAVFGLSTWGGFRLAGRGVSDTDMAWWERNVGPIPGQATERFAAPPGIDGRHANWYHRSGGDGSEGGSEGLPREGLLANTVSSGNPLICGRAMNSLDNLCAYSIGVALPLVAIERRVHRAVECEPGSSCGAERRVERLAYPHPLVQLSHKHNPVRLGPRRNHSLPRPSGAASRRARPVLALRVHSARNSECLFGMRREPAARVRAVSIRAGTPDAPRRPAAHAPAPPPLVVAPRSDFPLSTSVRI